MSIVNRWKRRSNSVVANQVVSPFAVESLEDRRLLSVAHPAISSASGGGHGHGRVQNTITFSQLPGGTTGAVATELDTLAGSTLASTQTVYLGNSHGVETYSVHISGTGTEATYTVDSLGDAVTAPTQTTTTFSALSATVSAEFSAIAIGDGLTDPAVAGTATVNVSTPALPSTAPAVYTLRLSNSKGRGGQEVSVDANGNPVGNETITFSALSTALQGEITGLVPTTDTAPAATSKVRVETVDGVTLYSVTVTGTGSRDTITVNESGAATSLPSEASTTFSALTSTVSTELQTLATADGYTGTIAGTTAVEAYTEANGTIVYAVSVPVSKTSTSGNTYTLNITVASDEDGNPTVPPNHGGGGGGCGGGGFFGGDDDGGFGGDNRRGR